ncbi:MAG: tetratricopeptide repeat protein [Burkholderiales bacterium]|nr:tetratricopeptide repeat protein [Burkholderiales bacterium]
MAKVRQFVAPAATDDEIRGMLDLAQWPQVVAAADNRLIADGNDAEALNFRGIALMALKQHGKAVANYNRLLKLVGDEPRFLLNAGVANIGYKRNKRARKTLEAAYAAMPENLAVRYHLGRLEIIEDRYPEALEHLSAVDHAIPGEPEVLKLLAVCLRELGKLPEAVGACEAALKEAPGDPWLRNCIAICLARMGYFHEATRRVAQIIESLPVEKQSIFDLGTECQEQGSPHLGIEYFKKLYAYFPDDVDACVNLGICLQMFGQLGEALYYYNKAIGIAHDCAEALARAGSIYESIKDYGKALEYYNKALEYDPNHVDTMARLATRKKVMGQIDDAKALLRDAIKLDPTRMQLYLTLVAFLKEADEFDEAESVLVQAEKRWPSAQEVRHARADLCLKRADIAGAMSVFREILAEQPRSSDAMSGMLFCMNYDPELTPEALAEAYKEWDKRFNARYRDRVATFRNDPDPDRKLRIGYVSGDFRSHSVGFFAEPILEHHDHERFEIYCYANHNYVDSMTAKFMHFADHWRWILDLNDEAVLEMIRMDEIDILIDLSNHTAYHRLYMFARRAAPVQMTWIGMPTTTGVSAIDYRITDERMDPPGMTEALHAEKLLRLVSGWCYRPSEEGKDLPVGDLPALRNGHLTFASFNAFGKINTKVITLWGKMFHAIPDAILWMATGGKDDDEKLNEKVRRVFADCGFPMERLRLFGKKPMKQYLEFHSEIDIALDPFPYNGGTVTAHAIWMAVPVLSLAGRKSIQRMGATMMGAVGLSDFVVDSEEAYVEVGKRWARDLPGLAKIRASLRETMLASPLMDAVLVTRDLEEKFKEVWADWCENAEKAEETTVADQSV